MEQVTTKILDGLAVSNHVLEEVKKEVSILSGKGAWIPGLAVILVGSDPASQAYVTRKQRACENIGIQSFQFRLPDDTSQEDLESLIKTLNEDPKVNGILLQLPLPEGLDSNKMLGLISSEKDVDGFHPENVGKLLLGLPTFKSCTPYGVMELLAYYNISPKNKHVVIVGRSNIVGKPLSMMMIQRQDTANATVTICHSATTNIGSFTRSADILIAAVGKAHFIKREMVKEGAVVIDVGINRVDDPSSKKGYKLVGDVDFEGVKDVTSAITPVPGGIGPMTIAMLMKNTLQAFNAQKSLEK
jgi:methylenetetrahydrofolate dehydrogenase (NADP+) / methenyltetrahydrofolate cyclohydrolase